MLLHAIIDNITIAYTLINTRYVTYRIVLGRFIEQHNLKFTTFRRKAIISIASNLTYITEIVKMCLNINNYVKTMFTYILEEEKEYNLILRRL